MNKTNKMKIIIFFGLISITFAQTGYGGGGGDEGYEEVPDDGYAGGYAGEGSYGQSYGQEYPQNYEQAYRGINLNAQLLARALARKGGILENYRNSENGGHTGDTVYSQTGLHNSRLNNGGYGGTDGQNAQHFGVIGDMDTLYSQAVVSPRNENGGFKALSGSSGDEFAYQTRNIPKQVNPRMDPMNPKPFNPYCNYQTLSNGDSKIIIREPLPITMKGRTILRNCMQSVPKVNSDKYEVLFRGNQKSSFGSIRASIKF